MYFTAEGGAVIDKERIVKAFRDAGLDPRPESDAQFWVVAFAGSRVFVNFQERHGSLFFATLDVPMDENDAGNKVFVALDKLGWTSEEDVG